MFIYLIINRLTLFFDTLPKDLRVTKLFDLIYVYIICTQKSNKKIEPY